MSDPGIWAGRKRRALRRGARRRERGTVAVMVALMLPVLLGFAALSIDLGHVYLVRGQLQNAVDSGAMAGARVLDGTAIAQVSSRSTTKTFAANHQANGSAVSLDLNPGNSAGGDIVLGRWHGEASPKYFEYVANPAMYPTYVNAVQVTARRSSSTGNAVAAWFAQVLSPGRTFDVGASAIGLGGGPSQVCGAFPIVIPDCELRNSSTGSLNCGTKFTIKFTNDISDTAGFTTLNPSPGGGTALIRDLVAAARNGTPCNPVPIHSQIYVKNGNNLNPLVGDVQSWMNAVKPDPLVVSFPVVDGGGSSCSSIKFNQLFTVQGYAKAQIVAVNGPPTNTIEVSFLCNQSDDAPSGGGFFGDKATQVYLVK